MCRAPHFEVKGVTEQNQSLFNLSLSSVIENQQHQQVAFTQSNSTIIGKHTHHNPSSQPKTPTGNANIKYLTQLYGLNYLHTRQAPEYAPNFMPRIET